MEDTIVAISTALGVGAISIVRVSGKDSIQIVNEIFNGVDLTKQDSHTVHYGFIELNGEKIDEVLLSVLKAPNTFTTEDVVEINCHGGILITNQVLDAVLESGARMAEPGEFTKRAFLNGRIDLVESESIMDLINAETKGAKELALNGLTGEITNLIEDLRKDIFSIIGTIEVNIDYPEYNDIKELTTKEILPTIKDIDSKMKIIIEEANIGKIIKDGIKVAIVGSPNVGKSSILNKLLGKDKAIVTDIAGTTRDVVEGSIILNGIKLDIVDTAGIRETKDLVEQLGVEKTKEEINNSDLVLVVLDSTKEITDQEKKLIENINKEKIVVLNKQDLKPKEVNIEHNNIVKIDTVTKDGVEELKNKIIELFNLEQIKLKNPNYLSNSRQLSLMKTSKKHIEESLKGIKEEKEIDLIEIDLKEAWQVLGSIIGASYDEELIDDLFQNFCLGK